MIRVRCLRSFDDSLAGLDDKSRKKAIRSIRRLLDYFAGGPRPIGLGLRKLREPYWEIRVSLERRVIFSLEGGLAVFVLVGSRDEIRRCLGRQA